MTIFGTVANGTVVLPPDARLPEGTEVRIETITPPSAGKRRDQVAALRKLAASLDGLPTDLAKNHDHYLSGTPRR